MVDDVGHSTLVIDVQLDRFHRKYKWIPAVQYSTKACVYLRRSFSKMSSMLLSWQKTSALCWDTAEQLALSSSLPPPLLKPQSISNCLLSDKNSTQRAAVGRYVEYRAPHYKAELSPTTVHDVCYVCMYVSQSHVTETYICILTYVCILYLTRYICIWYPSVSKICVGALEWVRWTPYFNDRNFAACSMSFKDSSLPWNSSHTAACCSCLLCTSRTSFGWLHTFFRYCRAYEQTVHSYTQYVLVKHV